jgi:hypothetical protein
VFLLFVLGVTVLRAIWRGLSVLEFFLAIILLATVCAILLALDRFLNRW